MYEELPVSPGIKNDRIRYALQSCAISPPENLSFSVSPKIYSSISQQIDMKLSLLVIQIKVLGNKTKTQKK